jgi:hypothetical protein
VERVIIVGNSNLDGRFGAHTCRERHFHVRGPTGASARFAFHGDTIRRGATGGKWFNKEVNRRSQRWAINQDADGIGVRIVLALD